MFWADKVAEDLKNRKSLLEWVDDMKTPSGRIHVGSLRGVVVHDLAYKALKEAGVNAKYTYVFDNHDPMDGLPVYLPKKEFEKYLGMPLFKIPSPEKRFANFAEYYALEFKEVFNAIGCHPEIIWAADLYMDGKMNEGIRTALDKADIVRSIYQELYKKPLPNDWYPFQAYCESCGKVSTTRVYNWNGQHVWYRCKVDAVDWTKGCGYEGEISPFSTKDKMAGKLPWKIEWAVKWKAIGITVEGAGKDHMSRGGSHDLASLVCERVIDYPVPYPIPYEFFLVGGKKMSSSKGLGSGAAEMLEILPPELLRFLMVKTKLNLAINFDPAGDTIPRLFDDYQEHAKAYEQKSDDDKARVFELSQIEKITLPPTVRFSTLAQWVQMPNMDDVIRKEAVPAGRQGLAEWAKYASIWVDRFAPDADKFVVQQALPDEAKNLSDLQKKLLQKIAKELETDWNAEEFQKAIFEWAKEIGVSSKDAFAAIYTSLLGKNHGPKAGWLILSLDKEFVKKRFNEVSSVTDIKQELGIMSQELSTFYKPELFSIANDVREKYPSISIGVAVIKGVTIREQNEELEKEKKSVLQSLEGLTTEKLGEYSEIQSYRKLYKDMGVDWHSRRPSPEALLRRVALQKGLYTVNTCVDAYNLIVMQHRVSVGAFDLDTLVFPTELRFARSGEEILLLGDSEATGYKESELAYFDQKGGYNIDFNFRDAQRTSVQLKTKNLYLNVDGVFDITPSQIEQSLKESCDIITKYCGGTVEEFGVVTTA